MKKLLHIFQFEWMALRRSNTLKILLLVTLGAGIYGIYFGKFEIDKQNTRITHVQQHEIQQFDSLLHWATLDTTLVRNKEKFERVLSPVGVGWNKHFTYYLANDPSPLAGLCLGQRDLFPSYYGFDVSSLHKQIYVGELANPMKLLTGNFDLSYVYIFLLPLLIVALFYNLYAAEKEGGTLLLLQSQPVPLFFTLASRGFLRFAVVILLATLLLILAFLLQGISFTSHVGLFMQWLLLIYGYCFLWALIMAGIVWLRKSAALSAMMGLGVWLILTLITPAMLNLFVLADQPLPKRSEVIHSVRALNDKNWKSPKSFVFDQFYPEHPQYDQGDTTDFHKWYYASFTLLDNQAKTLNEQFEEQVAARNKLLNQWQWLAPAAAVHERLSSMAQTDRNSHIAFLREVESFHQGLKDVYYSRIFANEAFDYDDLQELRSRLNL